ncbi:S66 peptidase family protein [Salininema proteolyticum]|uniref:LD-carboxypeptidase n=1 Tax=Salininema proteolyticum TaxID=1607685 RepID=A0ABV8TTF6_9ACTN
MAAATVLPAPASAKGHTEITRPPALRPGDLVVVPSPAGPTDAAAVEKGVALLESWGLEVELTPHALGRDGYLSGTDEERTADLEYAFSHPDAKAVIATRGGYGSTRILDRVDYTGLRDKPKLVAGYSDITALHAAVHARAGLATLHSPMVAWADGNTDATAEALKNALMTADPVRLERDDAEPTADVLVPGRAEGRLLGGNLSLLAAEIGSRNFPDLDGAILFLEDVGEERYRVDGLLTSLIRSGHLDGVAGFAIGQFLPAWGDEPGEGEWTMADVITDRLAGYGVPILGGLKLGHGDDPRVAPLGTEAEMDAETGVLTVESALR